jgi:hypothetical protein
MISIIITLKPILYNEAKVRDRYKARKRLKVKVEVKVRLEVINLAKL